MGQMPAVVELPDVVQEETLHHRRYLELRRINRGSSSVAGRKEAMLDRTSKKTAVEGCSQWYRCALRITQDVAGQRGCAVGYDKEEDVTIQQGAWLRRLRQIEMLKRSRIGVRSADAVPTAVVRRTLAHSKSTSTTGSRFHKSEVRRWHSSIRRVEEHDGMQQHRL
ncbi:hypothetical protein BHE74_00009228 [Ensete ventricosum]|nr:hypothetical protein GW17_00053736 [Ensete ventricosum]RWW82311.1 hypothetical protein BHE74_00009228 [Ensete ventricosum]RZS12432.1 hypothetical protein BHM03_00043874 [Ensete ventricosum]